MAFPFRPTQAALTLLAALTVLFVGACIYDPDQRCGPAMTLLEDFGCVCAANAIAIPGGCQACAADEVVVGGQCACPAGQRKNPAGVCTPIAGLGAPCDTVTAPCQDATYSYCDTRGGGTAGTCTSWCTSDGDCGAAYTCAMWMAQPYCRTFEGAGKSCSSAADCGGDATYCDTRYTDSCHVAGCSVTANDCPRGNVCCDYTAYGIGTLCGPVCL